MTPEQLAASLSAVDPSSGEQLGRRYQPGGSFVDKSGVTRRRRKFSAFDMVYSPPKSVSAAWALADGADRKEIEQAWDISTQAVVGFIQSEAVASRAGRNGVIRVEVPDGATIARFDHWTSRAGDPHVHSHLIVHNRVRCEDGKWRTLDGRLLYRNAAAAAMVGAAVLRAELSQRLGWSWDRVGDNWHAELAGRPEDLISEWSARHRDIAKVAQAKVRAFEDEHKREPTPTERLDLWDKAKRHTRKPKETYGDHHARWRAEAEAAGVTPDTLAAELRAAPRREPGPYDRVEVLVSDRGQQLPDTLAAGVVAQLEQLATASRGLTRPDILRTVWATLNASTDLCGSDIDPNATLARLADDLWERVCDQLVERDGRWYSPGLAAAEVASVSWLGGEAAPDRSEAEADTEGLGSDQTAAVTAILEADTNGVLVIGPAGAGKTEMLGRVAGAVGTGQVLAVAPTAAAAANLGEALDVAAETAALAAITDDRVPQGGWVIVDEAGQLDTRTLAALAGRAARARARMVLVGDTAQQGSVGAGGVFQALADRPDLVPAAVLSELWRFEDRDEARATIGLRVGDKSALDYHTERGRVHDTTEPELADFAAAWWEQRRDQNTIITAPTLSLVTEINTEIAARRHRSGETGDIVSGAGGDAIRVGDTVATRRNHRRIVASDGQWVRNGDRWVVTGGHKDGAVTAHRLDDETTTVVLPGPYVADHLDLGYATTQARVQSLTVDASLCAVTVASRRAQAYVGLTRGRRANHLMVVTDQPQHDPDTPPDHLPPDHIIEAVLKRGSAHPLSVPAGTQQIPAHVAAAHLGQIADTPHAAPLPDLDALNSRRSLGTAAPVTDSVEARVSSDIEAWLDGQHAEDEAARRWEDTFLAALDAGEDVEELFAPAVADPDDWAPFYDLAPEEYEDLPPDHYDDHAPETGPATPPPPAPVELAPDVEGAVAAATEAWGADHFEPFLALADSWARKPSPHPVDDPGPLVDLVARYQLTRRVGDRDAASHTVALMAAVADPTLRALLEPHVRRQLSPDETQWAADVRASLRARRAQRWSTTLEALDAARSRLHTQLPEGGPPGADLAAIDRAHWYQAVADWLDDGASAARLTAVWYHATQQTAQVIAEAAEPSQAPIPVPWTQPTNPPAAAGPRLPAMRPIPLPNRTQPAPAEDSSQTPQRQVLERSADWYHQQLLRSPHAAEARQYLTDRGITPHDWKKWKLGWAPDRWRGLCNTIRDDKVAVESGVAAISRKTGRAYDVLRARIVFPIRTRGGDVIGFAGRKLPTNTDPRSPKYLNTRTTDLYHKTETLYGIAEAAQGIRNSGTAGIVEGYTDAIAAHKAGLTNVVATGGTAFTQSHLTRIVAAGAHHLIAAFDGDPSGQQAQHTVLDQAHQADIPTTAVTFPPGEDPASLETKALLEHWHTGLPQPWPHINQHLGGTDIHTRIRGHRAVADTYTGGDPIIAAIATHQALTHTLGATPHTIAAWHRPGTRAVAARGGSARTGPPSAGVSTVGGF